MPFTTTTEFIELQKDVKLHVAFSIPTTESPGIHGPDDLTLVFLHFWGGSVSTWSPVNSLVANSYTTLRLDFRGWGESTGPNEPSAYSTKDLADDVEAVIKHYKLANFVIVGHSMGAKVAQIVAGRNSNHGLRGLFLVAPAPPTPLVLPPDMREQQIHAYDAVQSADFVTRNVLSTGSLSDQIVKDVVQDMLKGNQFARAAWPGYGMAEDVLDLAKGIHIPVFIVAAERDSVEPPERVKAELCATISTASLVVLPGSGHLVPLEAPEELGRYLENFISTLK